MLLGPGRAVWGWQVQLFTHSADEDFFSWVKSWRSAPVTSCNSLPPSAGGEHSFIKEAGISLGKESYGGTVGLFSFFFLLFFLDELRPRGVVILARTSDNLHYCVQIERMCQSNSYLFLLVYVRGLKKKEERNKETNTWIWFHFSVFQIRFPLWLGIPDSSILTPELTCALSCELWDNYPAGLAHFPSVIIARSGNKAAGSLHSLRHPTTPLPPPLPSTHRITGGKQLASVVDSAPIASIGGLMAWGWTIISGWDVATNGRTS